MEKDNTQKIYFVKTSENAVEPTRGTPQAAGLDLSSAYEYTIAPNSKCLVQTDLIVKIPPGCYGRVAPRSGLALKHFIGVGAGVIDADYRGKLGVILFNHSTEEFVVRRGDRIAQFICERIFTPDVAMVMLDSLDSTERGAGGFGSTGINDSDKSKVRKLC